MKEIDDLSAQFALLEEHVGNILVLLDHDSTAEFSLSLGGVALPTFAVFAGAALSSLSAIVLGEIINMFRRMAINSEKQRIVSELIIKRLTDKSWGSM